MFPLNNRSDEIMWTEYMTENQVHTGLLLQPVLVTLTYRRHSTDTKSRSSGREAELIQYCVGPRWIDHGDIAAEGRARHYPHRTLAERDGHGVCEDERHGTTCP